MNLLYIILLILILPTLIYILSELAIGIIPISLIALIIIVVFVYLHFHVNGNNIVQNFAFSDKTKKGVCYFDIDATLTTAQGNPNDIVQECMNNDFDIGIITASDRKLRDVCDGENPRESWMPGKLCKRLSENPRLFNSHTSIAGSDTFPSSYPSNKDYGYKKGWAMDYGRQIMYPNMPRKNVVLFDDNPDVLAGVKRYNPDLGTQCSNTTCNGRYLSKELVREKMNSLNKN